MKFLIDMNLSPDWVRVLVEAGFEAVHWSSVGDPGAPDTELMQWAKDHDHVVFTHDLDFGTLLYATGASAPSVMQFRVQDVRPANVGTIAVAYLKQVETHLLSGALVTIDPAKVRFHLLPLKRVN